MKYLLVAQGGVWIKADPGRWLDLRAGSRFSMSYFGLTLEGIEWVGSVGQETRCGLEHIYYRSLYVVGMRNIMNNEVVSGLSYLKCLGDREKRVGYGKEVYITGLTRGAGRERNGGGSSFSVHQSSQQQIGGSD